MPFEEVGLRASIQGLSGYLSGVDQIEHKTSRMSGVLKTALGTAMGFGGAQLVMGGVSKVFGLVSGSIIGMNSELETSTLQFETLFKDADRAKKHVKSLFDFAAKTPFETGPIIAASRIMQTFGGDALNTEENLRRVGDAAAVANQPINELGFWVGRAYSAIKNGQPFGEAAMRLQEMAVLSGEARIKMETLTKSGASAEEVWAVFTAELDKNKGAMEKQAGTWKGLTSTITDNIRMVSATAFKPLFDLIKEGATGLTALVSSKAFAAWGENTAAALTVLIDRVKKIAPIGVNFLKFWVQVATRGSAAQKVFDKLDPRLRRIAGTLGLVTGAVVAIAKEVGSSVWKDFLQVITFLWETAIEPLGRSLGVIAPEMDKAGRSFASNEEAIRRVAKVVILLLEGWLAFLAVKKVVTLTQDIVHTGKTLIDIAKMPLQFVQTITQVIKSAGELLYDITKIAQVWTQVITQQIARTGSKFIEKAEDFTQTITQKILGPSDKEAEKTGEKSGKSVGKGFGKGLLESLPIILGRFAAGFAAGLAILGGSTAVTVVLAAAVLAAIFVGAFLLGTEVLGLSVVETIASALIGAAVGAILLGPVGFLAGLFAGQLIYRFKGALAEGAGVVAGAIAALFYLGIPKAAEALVRLDEIVSKFFHETIPNLIIEGGPKVLESVGKFLLDIDIKWREFWRDRASDFFNFLTVTLPSEAGRGFPTLRDAFFTGLTGIFIDLPKWWYGSLIPATFTFFTSTLPMLVKNFITGTIPTLAAKAFELGKGIVTGLLDGIGDLFDLLKKPFEEGFNKAFNFVEELLGIKSPSTVYKGIGEDIVQGLINGILGMGDEMVKALKKMVEDAVSQVPGAELVIKTVGGAKGLIEKYSPFQAGAWNLPATTLGVLHKGEMVIPAPAAERIRDIISYPYSPTAALARQTVSSSTFEANINVESEDMISTAIRRELRGLMFSSGFAR